jgi:membrane protein implicated in regulation of membrane protease activity
MGLLSIWWAWIGLAMILGIAEMLIPGFIFLGFSIGAVVVALVLALGPTVSLPLLLLIFAALSLIAWLALRRWFALPKGQVKRFHDDINE